MKSAYAIAATLAVLLAGCGSKDEAPSGQVLATVNGEEITMADIRGEMGANESNDRNLQAQALDRIIVRKLLAAEARKQKLDETPQAAVLKVQAEETALAQLLARKVTDGVPKVSDDEISEFLRSFPASITNRRLLSVEQFFVPTIPQKVREEIVKVKTLEAAEAILNANKVAYRRTVGNIDTITLDPGIAERLVATEANDIYIMPMGQSVEIGRIVTSRSEPLAGDQAKEAARAILTRQRGGEMVNNALGKIIADGRRKVQVNPQFAGKAAPTAPVDATKQPAVAVPK